MHSKLQPLIATLTLAGLCGACAQTTRHSNTLIFGTNTSFGVKVGTDAAKIPSVLVGYDRQEAVIMPLVANTVEKAGAKNKLSPCDLKEVANSPTKSKYAVHPCSLVAVNGNIQDSYSVLASFGASFDGSSGSTDAKAKGGLAQYFATGAAAQILATTGGAAVVSVGEAALKSAEKAPEAANAVPTLFGRPFGTNDESGLKGAGFLKFKASLIEKINAASLAGDLQAKILAFEQSAMIETGMRAACTTRDACIARMSDYDEYLELYTEGGSSAKMETALQSW